MRKIYNESRYFRDILKQDNASGLVHITQK